jgi:hypothetical protein
MHILFMPSCSVLLWDDASSLLICLMDGCICMGSLVFWFYVENERLSKSIAGFGDNVPALLHE